MIICVAPKEDPELLACINHTHITTAEHDRFKYMPMISGEATLHVTEGIHWNYLLKMLNSLVLSV